MNFNFIEPHWIFDEYAKAFPHNMPSIFVQEQMLSRIEDKDVWIETVVMWAMNQYRADSIGKMIDCYDDKVKEKQPKSYNYVNKQPTQREAIEAEQRAIELMEVQ